MKTDRPKWLRDAFDYLLDNLFDILTIAAAAYVVVRGAFQPYGAGDIPQLATWLIGVVGLMAVSEMWERRRRLRRLETLASETHALVAHRLGGQVSAQDFFWPLEKKVSKQDFAGAREICVAGMLLNRTVREHLAAFSDRVSDGASLRFIITDLESDSLLEMIALRSYGARPAEWWRNRLQQTSGHIEDIQNTEPRAGTVSVGYLPYLPSFGLWLIDPGRPEGKIFVEIYHHRNADPNAAFTLTAASDPYWYAFFQEQFELMWQSCQAAGRVTTTPPSGG